MSSLFDLTGKVAIITGSTKGIGLAIAQRMAEHGATVVVSSRKADVCKAVAAEIRARGGKAVAIPCHIARKEELQNLVDQTFARCGGIDIMVGMPAVNPYLGPAAGVSDEVYERVMGANARSQFLAGEHGVSASWPNAAAARSLSCPRSPGLRGSATLGLYGISKAADMRWYAISRSSGGRRTCVPTPLRLAWCAPILPARCGRTRCATARCTRDNPLQRIGEPDEMPGAAVFLASAAGSYVNGQTIVVDGGASAGTVIQKED